MAKANLNRSFSTITTKEATELVCIANQTMQLPKNERVTKNEVWIDAPLIKKGVLHIDMSIRCFEGYLTVDKHGNVFVFDEEDKRHPIENQVETMVWLIDKGFIVNPFQ